MNVFDRAASRIARLTGHPMAFALALLAIMAWGVLGPIAGYSDTWQLVINTATTIATFLIVFLIQNTQNRDSHALHLKIDELLRALDAADTRLVDLEERSEQELDRLREHYKAIAGDGAPEVAGDGRPSGRNAKSAPHASRSGREPRNQSSRRDVQEP